MRSSAFTATTGLWQSDVVQRVQQASEDTLQQDAGALKKHLQGLKQHQAALESAGLSLDMTAPWDAKTPADGKLVRLAVAVTLDCIGVYLCLLRHGCKMVRSLCEACGGVTTVYSSLMGVHMH